MSHGISKLFTQSLSQWFYSFHKPSCFAKICDWVAFEKLPEFTKFSLDGSKGYEDHEDLSEEFLNGMTSSIMKARDSDGSRVLLVLAPCKSPLTNDSEEYCKIAIFYENGKIVCYHGGYSYWDRRPCSNNTWILDEWQLEGVEAFVRGAREEGATPRKMYPPTLDGY